MTAWLRQPAKPIQWPRAGLPVRITDVPGGHRRQKGMTRHEWLKQIARRFVGRGVSRFGLQLGVMLALGTSGAFAAENGTNLPWEGPLTDWPGRLCHFGDCDCCARSDAGFRRRRDGRNDEAFASCRDRGVLCGFRSTGDDVIHWPGRRGCDVRATTALVSFVPW